MRFKPCRHKKLAVACGIAAAVLAGLIVFALPHDEATAPITRREYPVKKDNIVVGLDASGTISSEKHSQFIDTSLQIKEYKVKIGDFVHTGDVLAELSAKDITEKLKAANEKLKTDLFAVEKLKTEKKINQQELTKKIDELRAAGESAYQEKAGLLLSQKAAAENGIAEKEAKKQQLKASIGSYQAEKAARAAKIAALADAIAKLQADNSALQQKIDALVKDTATDHTAEIARLTQEKIENELSAAEHAREKKRLETTDYEALIANANTQIAELEAENGSLNAALSTINSSLKGFDAQRSRDRAKEDETIALFLRQGQAQQAGYDNEIGRAQSTAADSEQARDKIRAFEKSPQILAEYEGTVFKLGYTPNATTEITTPVIELGAEDKKLLVLQVDPADIADVKPGQEVSFYVDAYADATFQGKVEDKAYLQNDKGKFEVTASFTQTEQRLLDGMGANATLIVKQKRNILTVSDKAIFLEGGKNYVYCTNETGALQKREIVTGFSNGRITEIVSGLADGDTAWVEEQHEDI